MGANNVLKDRKSINAVTSTESSVFDETLSRNPNEEEGDSDDSEEFVTGGGYFKLT